MWDRRVFRLIGSSILQTGPILVAATFIVFVLMHLVPGDIAITLAGESATAERIEEIRSMYGLDQPIIIQYATWFWKMIHGDLSVSLLSREPVLQSILYRLPVTLLIVSLAMVMSLAIGVTLGVFASLRPRSTLDSVVTTLASVGIALPNFWLAMILVSFLALRFQWLPVSGMTNPVQNPADALYHAFLPALALAAGGVAEVARQTRSALMEVQASQHMRTLAAKGLPQSAIFWKHGLKNISVTLLTVVGLLFNRLLGGTVVIEAVFAISGMGSLVVSAATGKDFPVVQGVMLAMVVIVIFVNLAIEILYAVLDPRVKRR
ncbi:ABC transporter permease [Bradyrhizobium iriomotense]|uniref:ABC transporter permease n=1 Tax=Bradyrhizobium iriomotense TaxID=441950 RepID=UPI001B89F892|nr:ABC transporter permease [Bradyrhizobium iriomotense]MBR0784743.1 ABC transporter permease [Bradyrhizobium iriomotense]